MKFDKHYTVAEARALLPKVRRWLEEFSTLRTEFERRDSALAKLNESGADVGGPPAEQWVSVLADMRDVLNQFARARIQLKDADRGLVDFPAILNGQEVFLCWEMGEEDIEHWHELEAGYAGRKKL